MAYNKFKIADIRDKLHLKVVNNSWLANDLSAFGRDAVLEGLLLEAMKLFLGSEKARSEFVVTPVLQALNRKNEDKFTIFSGYEFNIDKKEALNGFCDFILSAPANSFLLEAPAFFIAETKKTDIDDNAIAQCCAEMYAARIFNDRAGKPKNTMYGCATSGFSWAFLKLENDTLYVDPNYVPLTFPNPYNVLATLQWVLDKSLDN